MTLREEQKAYYADLIRGNIRDFLLSHRDELSRSYIYEVSDALALGCVLSKPRAFGKQKKKMGATDFQRIAENITIEQIALAINSLLKHKQEIKNRTWYILGILSRF